MQHLKFLRQLIPQILYLFKKLLRAPILKNKSIENSPFKSASVLIVKSNKVNEKFKVSPDWDPENFSPKETEKM